MPLALFNFRGDDGDVLPFTAVKDATMGPLGLSLSIYSILLMVCVWTTDGIVEFEIVRIDGLV